MPRGTFWLTLLALVALTLPLPTEAHRAEAQRPDVVIKNQYIEALFNERGQFTIGTVQGDPATTADDNRKLTYGHREEFYTSFTSVRIVDGGETRDIPLLQGVDQAPQVNGDAATTRWRFGAVVIEQRLAPVTNPYTNRPDTFRIATTVRNEGGNATQVGVRVMLDTMIGDNDNAPFFIPGTGNLAEEREYTGTNMPSYWKAFEATDFSPASLKGQGILTGSGATPPDRFVVARWPEIKNSIWDYEITPGMPVGDSAVAIYWQPKQVAPGASSTYITYYGLAGAGGGQAWIDAPVSVTSQEPGLQATLWVSNRSDGDFTGGEATLSLPPGLRLAPDESAHKAMARVPAGGGAQSVTWRLMAGGNVDRDYPYSATVTFRGGSGPLSASTRLSYRYIAPTAAPTPTPVPTPTAGPTAVLVPMPAPPQPRAGLPWWPLLLIPLLGIPALWLLLRRRPAGGPRAAPPPSTRPRPARPVMFDQAPRSPGPTGADITHGRRKPPREGE